MLGMVGRILLVCRQLCIMVIGSTAEHSKKLFRENVRNGNEKKCLCCLVAPHAMREWFRHRELEQHLLSFDYHTE